MEETTKILKLASPMYQENQITVNWMSLSGHERVEGGRSLGDVALRFEARYPLTLWVLLFHWSWNIVPSINDPIRLKEMYLTLWTIIEQKTTILLYKDTRNNEDTLPLCVVIRVSSCFVDMVGRARIYCIFVHVSVPHRLALHCSDTAATADNTALTDIAVTEV